MAIGYNYVDPKDMSAFQIIEPGEGSFKILKAEEKQSRQGNNMMEVTMTLTNTRGQSTLYREYIVSSDDPIQNKSTATKIYNILNAIGRADVYGMPLIDRHLQHGSGKCIIKTQKSDDERYPDKSVVSQYISRTDVAASGAESATDLEDSIPF